jgi:hypothetical protein
MLLQSTEFRPGDSPRRCVGRPAIERSIRALLIRVHRFARHRATSPADIHWAAVVLDSLIAVLEAKS